MDVCSVHHNNTFLKYSVSLLGYGFYGDLLADSDTKRWLGPARYDLAGNSALQSLRLYIEEFNEMNPIQETCRFSGTFLADRIGK